jgi:hypothetical protein
VVTAIEAVRAGKVTPEPQAGGKALYRAEGITFLLRAKPSGVN